MEENVPWKAVYFGTIFSLIILAIAYYFITPSTSEFFSEEKIEKIAEFKNTRIAGRKAGKKSWEIYAQEGWTNRNYEITYLKSVQEGKVYVNDKLVVKKLVAPRAKAHRRSEIIEASGFLDESKKGRSKLSAYINLKKLAHQNNGQWTKIIANYMKYIPNEKVSEMVDKVKLFQDDSTIYAQKIKVDHDKGIAEISDNISLVRKDAVMTTKAMKYFSQDEKVETNGAVQLKINQKGLKTRLRAKQASFYTDSKKPMSFKGQVEVTQQKKLAVAQAASYIFPKKELTLKDQAKIVFEKAAAILTSQRAKQLRNLEAKQSLKQKTILSAQKIVFSTSTGDLTASGSVEVSQKGKVAKAKRARYNEKSELITLSGEVYIKKDQDWVKAKSVVVSVKDETFEAIGAVEAKFKI